MEYTGPWAIIFYRLLILVLEYNFLFYFVKFINSGVKSVNVSKFPQHQQHRKFPQVTRKTFWTGFSPGLWHSKTLTAVKRWISFVFWFQCQNSTASRQFQGKFIIQLSLLILLIYSLTILGIIWPENLCPASQWKCWKSNISLQF